ncbi:hypothetical protein K437DRAFT_88497 [Tilletiaria anomala UBC 951]|uniref:Uncharacterized protein n=1 Tax=Tilletiaria anomala (strain ATCC 24038 / CBS 436.72 / UBC 951) TaxID=1037660 RepID=A0A066W6P5_TILAU|nr:uncharacterized protein K437DRAFT_88497 [Tilletiaria anomala UBC 951]KDN48218.1 hypothetical protein K437DRAFT_88497 [Tilletiaria anomala UBC 951]
MRVEASKTVLFSFWAHSLRQQWRLLSRPEPFCLLDELQQYRWFRVVILPTQAIYLLGLLTCSVSIQTEEWGGGHSSSDSTGCANGLACQLPS